MNNEDVESKLTPAAREALVELVDDYRRQILFGAMRSASSYAGEVEEISVRDVLTSVNRVDAPSGGRPRPYVDRMYRVVMIVGFAYTILGFGYFLVQSIEISLDLGQTIGLATGLSGTLITLAAYFYTHRRAQERAFREQVVRGELFAEQRVQESDASMLLIKAWRGIELAVRAFVASTYGESMARDPFSILIDRVEASDVLTKEDQQMLRHLLRVRNKVVHEGLVLDARQLRSALQDADRILSKIERSTRAT